MEEGCLFCDMRSLLPFRRRSRHAWQRNLCSFQSGTGMCTCNRRYIRTSEVPEEEGEEYLFCDIHSPLPFRRRSRHACLATQSLQFSIGHWHVHLQQAVHSHFGGGGV